MTVHLAGPLVDLVQRCSRCGEVMSDYRGAMAPEGDPFPRGWSVGAHVAVDGIQPRSWWLTEDAPTCEPRLVWPERPTCHDDDPHARRFAGPAVTDEQKALADKIGFGTWRQPRVDVAGDYRRQDTFRTCWYCGSIHPEDLYLHLANWTPIAPVASLDASTVGEALVSVVGSRGVASPLAGSDWKYGWPHKFYVEGLPNLRAGETEIQYMYGGRDGLVGRGMPGAEPEEYRDGFSPTTGEPVSRWRIKTGEYPSPRFAHAKFYNQHLMDLDDACFAALAPLIQKYGGIEFSRDSEGLKYKVPHRGYQR